MRILKIILLSFFLVGLAFQGCRKKGSASEEMIPFSRAVLSDTSALDLLGRKPADDDRILIVGEPEDAALMADAFLKADIFDNVSAKSQPDSLPDFSGETVVPLFDYANAPYAGYYDFENEHFLREIAVRNFLFAISPSNYMSPYDKEPDPAQGAKAVVIASPMLSAYGYSDIDTLQAYTGNEVAVISPIHTMFEIAVERCSPSANIIVWTNWQSLGEGIYSTVCMQNSGKSGLKSVSYQIFSPDSAGTAVGQLANVLEKYLDSGGKQRIDAILVDDLRIKQADLEQAVLKLKMAEKNTALSKYSLVMDDDLTIIDIRTAAAIAVYRKLRARNLFCHRIAYPEADFLITLPSTDLPLSSYDSNGDFTPEYKFSRAAGNNANTYLPVVCSNRFKPVALTDFIKREAPNLYYQYVRK